MGIVGKGTILYVHLELPVLRTKDFELGVTGQRKKIEIKGRIHYARKD